ncbi:MAG: hypothetical protein JXR21_03820 [Candidatus Marinimicrobia bacterium]|nr:hypothetical protein [Candidatus Neomarinimicrobiota bacterium]
MTQKHLSKKELHEDPFFEEVAHVIGFFQKNRKTLLIAGIVLAAVLIGFFGIKGYRNQQNVSAAGYFGIAMDEFGKRNLPAAEDQFLLLAGQYGNTDWGKRANYYLGLLSQELQRPEEETLDYFKEFISSDLKDNALKSSACQLIGTTHYRSGDALTAGDYYLKAAKFALSKSDKLALGIRAGEAYLEGGDAKKRDAAVNYLASLDLDEIERNRVSVLAKR